jgi:WD40 repeat protein
VIVTASRDRTARIWTLGGAGESKVLRGHTDKVYVARFDPRGKLVATVSRDGTARLWPAGGAGDPRVLRGHTAPVVDVAFSKRRSQLVTAAEDGTARVWDAPTPTASWSCAATPAPSASARFTRWPSHRHRLGRSQRAGLGRGER